MEALISHRRLGGNSEQHLTLVGPDQFILSQISKPEPDSGGFNRHFYMFSAKTFHRHRTPIRFQATKKSRRFFFNPDKSSAFQRKIAPLN
jgi:hypothetical protein